MEKSKDYVKVLAQAALCAALCYVGATFIKIDIPVGTEKIKNQKNTKDGKIFASESVKFKSAFI